MADVLAQISEILGDPYFESDHALLYQGDCLELMAQLPDCLGVPLTVTSPPYNIGKDYEAVRPVPEYVAWCSRWLTEIDRISARDAAFWLNLGYIQTEGGKAVPLPYLLWDKCPMYLMQEVVWHYGAGVAARTSLSPRNEKFLWYVKDCDEYVFNLDDIRDPNVKYPNQKKNGKIRVNPKGKNPSDVWIFPKVTSGRNRSSAERTDHPAQFPLDVISRIVLGTSNRGDVVFDPFIGSGTTAEAAIRHGRRAVGFEVRSAYLDVAVERIVRAENSSEQLVMGV